MSFRSIMETRTPVQKIQVFLRADQKAALKSLSARTGVRQSDLVRRGVDLVLEAATDQSVDWRQATRAAAGLWRDREDIDTTAGGLRRSFKKRFSHAYARR